MTWEELTSKDQLEEIIQSNDNQHTLIFKHSTRCSISSTALDRLLRKWNIREMEGVRPFYLDLIRNREVSNFVSEKTNVPHQSPQVLLIKNGKVVYDESHFGIDYSEIRDLVCTSKRSN